MPHTVLSWDIFDRSSVLTRYYESLAAGDSQQVVLVRTTTIDSNIGPLAYGVTVEPTFESTIFKKLFRCIFL